uniref:Uncharacterized protein n=1 Tax=Roseihalotalea indica TaxID=2867963 RepID=A0AA49GU02_9BACT|nr:hypothetical protein K4G66_11500 [Tunicatimonas sp. TK19036]
MSWLPIENETLVLPYPADEVFHRLRHSTKPIEPYAPLSAQEEEDFLFNGVIKPEGFRLSRKLTRPNSFLPMITGKVAPTSKGCIVFLTYKMFSASLLFILFWSVLTLLIALYFFFYEKVYGYGTIAVLIGGANYTISLLSFKKQVVISSQMMKYMLQT